MAQAEESCWAIVTGFAIHAHLNPARAAHNRKDRRAHYKAEQGDAFSLLFNHGMPPIRLLREIMFRTKRNRMKPVTQASGLCRRTGFQPETAVERAKMPV
jgi:hypothetical protein